MIGHNSMDDYNIQVSEYRVSMRDIDIFGHVHNSVYLDYCEDAVSDHLRRLGVFSHFSHKRTDLGYFVKKAEVTFFNALHVEDTVVACVSMAKMGNTSLCFEIKLSRKSDAQHCATAQLVWVCVNRQSGTATPIPDETRNALSKVGR